MSFTIFIITNFVVVSSVGVKRVGCICCFVVAGEHEIPNFESAFVAMSSFGTRPSGLILD